MFKGFKAYEQLFASKDIDAVYIATPPYFHPDHLEAAIAAGKHIYLEKPVAVDVPGAKKIMALGEKMKGKLSLAVGFQIRYASPYVAAREADPRRPDRLAGVGPDPLLRVEHRPPAVRRQVGRRAAPPELDLREDDFRRHHRRAEHPHHRLHELAAQRPAAEGLRQERARRTARTTATAPATTTACSRIPRTCTSASRPPSYGKAAWGVGMQYYGTRGMSPKPGTTRRCASRARPTGSTRASAGRRRSISRRRSRAGSAARSTMRMPTSRRRSSAASSAATC